VTRDEWNAYAASVPLTPPQRGAILGHCARLGLVDRRERLAVLAELLNYDGLESTADLTLGDAGRLVNILEHTHDRAELPDVGQLDGDGQDGEHDAGTTAANAGGVSLADALMQIAVMLWQLFGPGPEQPKSTDGPPAPEEKASGD